jgi:aminoglycoside/choline kinase family phosphotransferase
MNSYPRAEIALNSNAREFLSATTWKTASCEPLTGDASTRKYFRLRNDNQSAILMDASRNLESVAPFVRMSRHLLQLGFSAPTVFACDPATGLMLLEDFGDDTFARLLDNRHEPERLFALAIDVLVALHQHPRAIPPDLRVYHPQKMLADIELFLEWRTPAIAEAGKAEFKAVWLEVLPLSHQAPTSLLLRDYHVANLMLLTQREGIRQAGLLDFQDAYRGPVTYDLMSLLEDARRDLPAGLEEKMVARYLAHFPALDRSAFEISLAVVAAQRHTRVLAIFERLSRHEGKHEYRRLHSPRVERRLKKPLSHPCLARVKQWMERYAR